ncbi:peroxisome biogenesis factor 1-like isoform X2 [Acanthaster planci]|uniref:Peroxisomal ATPase PEX1 n=1 Tax=Acanthaster planci TaxID=133434 RepID=A0A8B7ZU65_ACAPL|nr:peroxisome biogenesis factor 1-like isoform X2 [Acanthaster planci]
MALRIAVVDFTPMKSCFISLPVTWGQEFQRKQSYIFELQWGDRGRAYVSWAGDTVRLPEGHADRTPMIQINGLYGNKLGLCHGEEILLQPVPKVHSCSRVSVEPATSDDWEILELNTGYVESNLLNQVRIVWTGQILPIWIEKKICIFIRIGATDPPASCVQLEPNTELIVAPKSRRNQAPAATPVTNATPHPNQLTGNPDREHSERRLDTSLPSSSSMGSIIGSVLSGFTSDYDSATSPSDTTFSTARLTDASSSATTPSEPWDIPTEVLDKSIPWSYRFWRRIRSVFVSDEAEHISKMAGGDMEEARRKMAAEFWKDVRIIARVQPMFEHRESSVSRVSSYSGLLKSQDPKQIPTSKRHHIHVAPSSAVPARQTRPMDSPDCPSLSPDTPRDSFTGSSYTHLMQPTTVYLSSNCETEFVRHHDSNTDEHQCPVNEFVTFVANLAKLPSPREKKEEVNRKFQQTQSKYEKAIREVMEQQKHPQMNTTTPTAKDAAAKGEDSSPSCVVRVIIHSNELRQHQNGQSENVYSSNTFQKQDITWFIQIPDLLRRQLGLESSAKVELRPVLIPPVPIHSISLFPLFDKPSDLTVEDLVFAFEYWVTCVSCMISPIPIRQHGTLLRFPISRTGDLHGEFLISINEQDRLAPSSSFPSSPDDPAPPYYLLHPLVAKRCRAVIRDKITSTSKPAFIPRMPSLDVAHLDNKVGGYRLRDLGGVTGLGQQAIDYLSAALMTRPISRCLGESLLGFLQGGLLVCGPRGSGKSALCRSVCREMVQWPSLAHVSVVECKPLKGKRIETIRKIWEEAVNEAAWRQPSIILLDDMDHVTASPLGPEQEIGQEAVYHTRLADVLKDIMMAEVKEGSRVCIVATTRSKGSLHQSLTSSRGCHLFQCCLEIPSLSKSQRVEVLNSAIQSKVEIDLRTFDQIDSDKLAARMEGYVARDIVTVVERAIHAGCCRELVEGRPVLPIEPVKQGKDSVGNADEILLLQEDFEAALHDYTPATLRDVPLHSAGELGWQDVGGLRDVKESLLETLQLPAKYPSLFANCPLRLRSGLLLYGPPGTGKTLLGGVVAKECGLNFISIKGPELLSKYIGASEQAVRDLFDRAQSARPCILFFDEFDSLAPRRGHDSTGVTDRVVNQLLTQLDGVEGLQGVYVIGATSRPDLIDPALLRPGRLDKCLFCPIPCSEERVEILQALSRKIPMMDDVDLRSIALKCEHFTGADFKALLYNAQLEAIHGTLSYPEPQDGEYDLTPLTSKHCSMGADDWKLTFLESFSAEGDSYDLPGSPRRQSRQENGNSAVRFGSPQKERSNTNSDSSTNSEFVRVDLQDVNGNAGSGEGGFDVPGRRSEVKGHSPSMRQLAAAKQGRSPRPHISDIIDSIENEEVPGPMEGPLDPLYRASGQGADQPQVIYMPTLRDGVVDPSREMQENIQSQVAVIKQSYQQRTSRNQGFHDNGPKHTDGSSVIHISQLHLLRAAADMKPSVTPSERARYQSIYDNFVQSRGGNFNPTPQLTGQKRATLA